MWKRTSAHVQRLLIHGPDISRIGVVVEDFFVVGSSLGWLGESWSHKGSDGSGGKGGSEGWLKGGVDGARNAQEGSSRH